MSCRIVFNRSFVSVLWIRVKVVCHRRNKYISSDVKLFII
jgi:hypothetical protein